MLRALIFFIFLCAAMPAFAGIAVKDVRIGLQEGGGTRFVLEMEQAADYNLFLLNNPPRAVIDLPGLDWSRELSPQGRGLVKGWRHGQFADGTRIVLDLSQPSKVAAVQLIPTVDGKGRRLVVDLSGTTAQELDSLLIKSWGARKSQRDFDATAANNVPPSSDDQSADADSRQEMAAPPVERNISAAPPQARVIKAGIMLPPALPDRRRLMEMRPLVVIDAGHGGVDPGALAVTNMREKDLTLSVARRLAASLKDSGRYRVKLTRSRDVFIPLKERVRIARAANADLFISLHADSLSRSDDSIRGATVYTLSDRASDAEAEALAESENRADALAGLEQVGDNDLLANILIDMSHRATLNYGRDYSAMLVRSMRDFAIRLGDNPQRAAGFAVLKAPDIPSVLIEMGYLSNRNEARLLAQADHQDQLVGAILKATDAFFEKHPPQCQPLAVSQ